MIKEIFCQCDMFEGQVSGVLGLDSFVTSHAKF